MGKIKLKYSQKLNEVLNNDRKLTQMSKASLTLAQKFDVEVNYISKSAKEKIEKIGGKVSLIK